MKGEKKVALDFKNRICDYQFDLSKQIGNVVSGTEHSIDLNKLKSIQYESIDTIYT